MERDAAHNHPELLSRNSVGKVLASATQHTDPHRSSRIPDRMGWWKAVSVCRRQLLQGTDSGLNINTFVATDDPTFTSQAYNTAVKNGALNTALNGIGLDIFGTPSVSVTPPPPPLLHFSFPLPPNHARRTNRLAVFYHCIETHGGSVDVEFLDPVPAWSFASTTSFLCREVVIDTEWLPPPSSLSEYAHGADCPV